MEGMGVWEEVGEEVVDGDVLKVVEGVGGSVELRGEVRKGVDVVVRWEMGEEKVVDGEMVIEGIRGRE